MNAQGEEPPGAPRRARRGGRLEGKLSVGAGAVTLCAVALAFGAVALTRRLNFDEALALRSGYWALSDEPGAPALWMPFNLLLGTLGRHLDDPQHVFRAARALVLAALSASAAFALSRRGWRAAAAFAALCATHTSFIAHGFEFRYDAALLCGLLIALGCLERRTRRSYVALGVVTAWLAAHHLKGVYYAACVSVWTLVSALSICDDPRARREPPALAGRAWALGLLSAGALWGAVTLATGRAAQLIDTYAVFADLASVRLQPPTPVLGPAWQQNTAWWLLVMGGAAYSARRAFTRGPRAPNSPRPAPPTAPSPWPLALLLTTLGFLPLHPHPWPYLLAVAVPFGSVVVLDAATDGLTRLRPGHRAAAALACLGALAPALLAAAAPAYRHAADATMEREVDTLRVLRRLRAPSDRIIDPAGLAYFMPACTTQWYSDSLFQRWVEQGRWMTGPPEQLAACRWALQTQRLGGLPTAWSATVARDFSPLSAAPALWVRRTTAAAPSAPARANLSDRPLRNYWYRGSEFLP